MMLIQCFIRLKIESFLDRKLFEFACSVPDQYLIQKGMTKYILREAVKGIVPEIVLNQKKNRF